MRNNVFRLATMLFLACFVGNFEVRAQMVEEEGYRYLYNADHQIKVRKPVDCDQDNQQLWNGAYVRIIDDMVYIYRDNVCITSAIQVWLEHSGYYIIQNDEGVFCIVDPYGHLTGVQGDELFVLWNSVVCVLQGNRYCLYTPENRRLGSLDSDLSIEIYYNGYYCFHNKGLYSVIAPSGELVNNSFSDSKPELMDNGMWRCKRNGKAFFVDEVGDIF